MNEGLIYGIYLISVVIGIPLIGVLAFNLRFRYLRKKYHNVEITFEDGWYRERCSVSKD